MGNCCKSIYKICDPIPDCLETLFLKTGINSTDLTILLVDKFKNNYTIDVTTDAEGIAEINFADELPQCLINPYSGTTFLFIKVGGEVQKLEIGGIEYDGLGIYAKAFNPRVSEYTLDPFDVEGCEFDFGFSDDFNLCY
jgi:hypothetical protein